MNTETRRFVSLSVAVQQRANGFVVITDNAGHAEIGHFESYATALVAASTALTNWAVAIGAAADVALSEEAPPQQDGAA